ncbi:flagellin [Entomospira culicis]|uniref:Flagellin n=1 Tax=Entomospira culicis TaxID=2719989 RepID=A0A968KTP0_9SPIO|nr:flagellin [Entomospira culicis]NIZ18443.1 flagellin [Entomospira culicis]NIZ68659.1 flagellin [Entomospira culicis]WDI37258.1 flagellin [Entomospira culicis]WDI38887.1 flagellin [Entomospira culicis]
MIINHNMSAMNANRNLNNTNQVMRKDMEKLAQGQRITRAGDDASGLAVSEKMRAQVRGLNQAVRNMNDGVSFIQTTEGYLQGTTDALQRIRELSVQAANGIYAEEDRGYIQVEVDQMVTEISRIASQAEFNTMKLLTGDFGEGTSGMRIHMGANTDQFTTMYVGAMTPEALSIGTDQGESLVDVSTMDGANSSIAMVDVALQTVNRQRADLGAYQNRMEMASRSQAIASENLQSTESQIRDLNMASGMVELAREQILNQAGTAMLAQANQSAATVTRLLG